MSNLIKFSSFVSLIFAPMCWAETTDPNFNGNHYVYSENAGWANTKASISSFPGMHIAELGVTGWLWFENTGWVNLSCQNTLSCSNNPFEVIYEGNGDFSGFAWAENAGWISFSCANTNSCNTNSYAVQLDINTGNLSGFAWSENLGWISFSCQDTSSCSNNDFQVDTEIPLPFEISPAYLPIFINGFE